MAKWIWQSRNWPSLTYDEKTLRPFEDQYLHLGGVARGILDQLDAAGRADVQISLFEKEAMETSAIESVVLDRWSLQSWLRRQLGLRSERRVAPEEAGMARMIVQLVSSLDEPLSTETLCEWNSLVMAGRSDVDEIGHYRRNPASMQIVSGPTGAYTVHYVAPPSSRVDAEMRTFLAWFNSSSRSIPALGRAGLAHLWFESIHPFADGNGRIGRSISQKVLGCAVGRPPMAMLSDAISRNRESYYSALNAAQTGADV